MAKIKPDINSGLSWLGTILQYIKEYGFFNIIKSLILLILIVLTLNICYNPIFIFEKYDKYKQALHQEATDTRLINDSKIQELLPDILKETGADRVWIIQYHNGTSDWNFGSMRFELCAPNIASIKWHYDNFHLSWLKLPGYLKEHRYYINTINNLQSVDCALHDILTNRKVSYIAVIEIKTDKETLGVLGCTWESSPNIDIQNIRVILNRYSGKLEELLPPQIKFK